MARIKYNREKIISIKNPRTYEVADDFLLSGLFYGGFQSPTPLLLKCYSYNRKKKIEKYIFLYQLLMSYGIHSMRVLRSLKTISSFIKINTNKYLLDVVLHFLRRRLYKMYENVLKIIWGSTWLPYSTRRLLFSLMSRKKMRLRRAYNLRKTFSKWLADTYTPLSFLNPIKGVDRDDVAPLSLRLLRMNTPGELFSNYIFFFVISIFSNMGSFSFYFGKARWFHKLVWFLLFVYRHRFETHHPSLNPLMCFSLDTSSLNSSDTIHTSSVGVLYLEQQLRILEYNALALSTSGRCVMVPFLSPDIYKYWLGKGIV